MKTILDKESQEFIIQTLKHRGVTSFDDLMDVPFKDINEENDFNRDRIMMDAYNLCGASRISMGRFRTIKEYNNRRENALSPKFKRKSL